MSDSRVAARYAKSLLDLAKEKNVLDKVNEDMRDFSTLCSETLALLQMLNDPILGNSKKKEVIKKIFDGKYESLTLDFFNLAIDKRRASSLAAISNAFRTLYNEDKGIQIASITTTFKLTEELRESFVNAVKDITNAKTVELEESIDESLIGGYVLRIADRQQDNSVKTKLNTLRRSLVSV